MERVQSGTTNTHQEVVLFEFLHCLQEHLVVAGKLLNLIRLFNQIFFQVGEECLLSFSESPLSDSV